MRIINTIISFIVVVAVLFALLIVGADTANAGKKECRRIGVKCKIRTNCEEGDKCRVRSDW